MYTRLIFIIAKSIQLGVRRFGKGGGTALPGLVAERLNKKMLPWLARQLQGSIVVAGTNGKTTTSRLIASYLEAEQWQIVHNRSGSNLTRGILSALIANADWNGKVRGDWGLFEVDEAVLPKVLGLLQPQYVVALNLFRDQLDRYGEVDTIATKWRTGFADLSDKSTVILNADDPLVAHIGQNLAAKMVYFGVDYNGGSVEVASYADSRLCPVCGRRLRFNQISYSHLGMYECPNHDFFRPEPQVKAEQVALDGMNGSHFTVQGNITAHIDVELAGLYNVYNVVAALTLASQLGLETDVLVTKTRHFQAVFGRLEKVTIARTPITLILVKNPTGYNQVIQTLTTDKQAARLWLLLNDRFADGRDVSWIWDVEFERLAAQPRPILVSGTRAYDLAVRLKYAGFEKMQVTPPLSEALRQVARVREPVYCLCTYTAMLELRRLLEKQRAQMGEARI